MIRWIILVRGQFAGEAIDCGMKSVLDISISYSMDQTSNKQPGTIADFGVWNAELFGLAQHQEL